MAIWGAQGIRDSMRRAYEKHLAELKQEIVPEGGIEPHHAALHGALVLRYAASYRAKPGALVWLELGPFLALEPGPAVDALSEYVVFKEKPAKAEKGFLSACIRQGLEQMSAQDQDFFLSAAHTHSFAWRVLAGEGEEEERGRPRTE